MGRKRCLQILECSISDSGLYTCEIGDLSTSCKLEVYGKPMSLKSSSSLSQLDAFQKL